MNSNEAKRLIQQTCQSGFDENRFRLFAKNLFNDLVESIGYPGYPLPDR